ncbi:MAG: gliding motility protein GldC [Hymenobacteraceae bacterium]|nr:gliding motility protein GldC [Hymenobacteraceae bacterium]
MKKSEIHFSIALDEQRVPEAISWQATEQGNQINFAKAINISLWDREDTGTLKIDLWTKDMPVDEMKHFTIDTIAAMSQSLYTATGDEVMATKMRRLCDELKAHVDEERARQQAEG